MLLYLVCATPSVRRPHLALHGDINHHLSLPHGLPPPGPVTTMYEFEVQQAHIGLHEGYTEGGGGKASGGVLELKHHPGAGKSGAGVTSGSDVPVKEGIQYFGTFKVSGFLHSHFSLTYRYTYFDKLTRPAPVLLAICSPYLG
jgi:hypothetical protein